MHLMLLIHWSAWVRRRKGSSQFTTMNHMLESLTAFSCHRRGYKVGYNECFLVNRICAFESPDKRGFHPQKPGTHLRHDPKKLLLSSYILHNRYYFFLCLFYIPNLYCYNKIIRMFALFLLVKVATTMVQVYTINNPTT